MKVHAKVFDPITGIEEEFITNNCNYVDPITNAVVHLTDYKYVEWESIKESDKCTIHSGKVVGTSKKITVKVM